MAASDGKETTVEGDAERVGHRVGNGRERSLGWVGTFITHVTEGFELFAEDNGRGHTVYCLRENVVFYAGEGDVKGGNSPKVDTVERGPGW